MKRRIFLFLSLLMLFCLSSQSVLAASNDKITIHIPTFQTTINRIVFDNVHWKYPLITYKGVTYFPMTYMDARFLNLETTWDPKDGLSVEPLKGEEYPWWPDTTKAASRNKSTYTASIPQFPVCVNGEWIDNSTEPYPLIQFRNVTYFPLTWHFTMEEFHWLDYSFTPKDGLVLYSRYVPSADEGMQALNDNLTKMENTVTPQNSSNDQGDSSGSNGQGQNDQRDQGIQNDSNDHSDLHSQDQNGQGDQGIQNDSNGQSDQSDPGASKGQEKSGQNDQGNQEDSNGQSVTDGK